MKTTKLLSAVAVVAILGAQADAKDTTVGELLDRSANSFKKVSELFVSKDTNTTQATQSQGNTLSAMEYKQQLDSFNGAVVLAAQEKKLDEFKKALNADMLNEKVNILKADSDALSMLNAICANDKNPIDFLDALSERYGDLSKAKITATDYTVLSYIEEQKPALANKYLKHIGKR